MRLRLRGARLTFPGTPGWQSLRRLFADLNQNAPPPTTPALTRGRGGSAKISQPSIRVRPRGNPQDCYSSGRKMSRPSSNRMTPRVQIFAGHAGSNMSRRVCFRGFILSYLISYLIFRVCFIFISIPASRLFFQKSIYLSIYPGHWPTLVWHWKLRASRKRWHKSVGQPRNLDLLYHARPRGLRLEDCDA